MSPRSPGLRHVARAPRAVDVQHVAAAAGRRAHRQEVRPGPADGELGQVGQRLADGGPKQEGAHHLVEGGQVLVELGVGVQALGVHQVGLPRGDLGGRGRRLERRGRVRRAAVDGGTHDDDGAGDGDGRHGSVGDGVPPVRVVDALVIAVDASLVGAEPQGQDGRGQRRWGGTGGGAMSEL